MGDWMGWDGNDTCGSSRGGTYGMRMGGGDGDGDRDRCMEAEGWRLIYVS